MDGHGLVDVAGDEVVVARLCAWDKGGGGLGWLGLETLDCADVVLLFCAGEHVPVILTL